MSREDILTKVIVYISKYQNVFQNIISYVRNNHFTKFTIS